MRATTGYVAKSTMAKRTRTSKERRRAIRILHRKIEAMALSTQGYVAVLTELRESTPHAWVKERINDVL